MKIVEEIKSLIKEANETTDVSKLIDLNLKISGYLVYVSEETATALRAKLIAYNERKEWEANYCITSDEGITKAEKAATVKSKPQRMAELETEVTYNKIKGFVTQLNEFQQALRQKVSYLRRESENSNQQP